MAHEAASEVCNFTAFDSNLLPQDERSDGAAIQHSVGNTTGRNTVPSVFIGGSCVGGGDETAALHRTGKLEGLLSAAGALTKAQ